MPRSRRGSSLVEMVIVLVMVGILSAIMVPRFRTTPRTQVKMAAQQLAQDLEFARTRALDARALARVAFQTASQSYVGYLDFNRDGALAQSTMETDSLLGFRVRPLPSGIVYGRSGGVPDLPTLPGAGTITLPNDRVDFDTRGLTTPLGNRGVIYLTHSSDPTAVAAVSVTGAAGIRAWVFLPGGWQ